LAAIGACGGGGVGGGGGSGAAGSAQESAGSNGGAAAQTGGSVSGSGSGSVNGLSAVALSAGVVYDALTDWTASFTAPGGQAITATVKGPAGITAMTPCPSATCYVMRSIGAGETPDSYFPAAVRAAVAANAQKLVIPQGTYNFQGPPVDRDSSNPGTCNAGHYYNCTPHWTIGSYPAGNIQTPTGIADLDIDLGGSQLNFSAPTTGIYILNDQRIKLENFTIDWPALHIASLGTIVADPNNPGHQALVLDDAYQAADPLSGTAVQIQAVDPWDDSTDPAIAPGRFDQSATNAHETYFIFGNAPQPTYLGKTTAGKQTFSCASCNFSNSAGDPTCSMFAGCANFDVFAVGARVIVRHYTYNGFAILMNWSNDVDIDGAHILTGPGLGIAVQNAAGFRGFRVANSTIKRASGRLISTASDGINISQFGGDVLLDGNEIAYQGDDGVNVSPLAESFAAASATSIIVQGGCPELRDVATSGDTLAFYGGSGAFATIASVSSAAGNCAAAVAQVTLKLDCGGTSACVTALQGLSSGSSFIDLSQQPVTRYAIRNNYFHENRGHGTVAGAPFGEILDNTYLRNSFGPNTLSAAGNLGAGNVLVAGSVLN